MHFQESIELIMGIEKHIIYNRSGLKLQTRFIKKKHRNICF